MASQVGNWYSKANNVRWTCSLRKMFWLASCNSGVTPKPPPHFELKLLFDGVGARTKVNRIANEAESAVALTGWGPIFSLKKGGGLGVTASV